LIALDLVWIGAALEGWGDKCGCLESRLALHWHRESIAAEIAK
jgi:hypothetical protein